MGKATFCHGARVCHGDLEFYVIRIITMGSSEGGTTVFFTHKEFLEMFGCITFKTIICETVNL